MRRWLAEPLLHFVLLGALLFGIASVWRDEALRDNEIVVTQGQIAHLQSGFERTWNRAPKPDELRRLIDEYVREEVFYREALQLGLDRDDRIVRQRLRQKLQFLTEGLVADVQPSDSVLTAFLVAHQDDYRDLPRVALHQLYFNPDRRGAETRAQAGAALESIGGREPSQLAEDVGDAFLMPAALPLSSQPQIARMFGREFAEAVMALSPGRWHGPIVSGYGLHLVWVHEVRAGRDLTVDDVRERLLLDWQSANRAAIVEQTYERLREQYHVRIEEPPTEDVVEATEGGAP